MLRERPDYLLVRVFLACGIQIHPCHSRVGEELLHLVLQPFRTEASHPHLAAAFTAFLRHTRLVPAVVALHVTATDVAVDGQRYIAVGALRHAPALCALYVRRVAPSVLEQDDLLAFRQFLLHSFHEGVAQVSVHLLAVVLPVQVNQRDARHLDPLEPFRHAADAVLACPGVVLCLDRGCGCAEQHACACLCGEHDGHRPCVVARGGVLLLVTRLMLLIDNHQPEVPERKEHCRPCAHDQLRRRVVQYLSVRFRTLCVGHARMIDQHTAAEHALQSVGQLRRQGYLRHKVQHLPALSQLLLYQVDIHLRLS